MRISRCRATISLTFALLASLVTWLVFSENSPLDNYFLYRVTGRNVVAGLVFLPYILSLYFWARLLGQIKLVMHSSSRSGLS